jgi:hypothetical protein
VTAAAALGAGMLEIAIFDRAGLLLARSQFRPAH